MAEEKVCLLDMEHGLMNMKLYHTAFKAAVRGRDRAEQKLSILEVRLNILTKFILKCKSLNELERISVVSLINSWEEEDSENFIKKLQTPPVVDNGGLD